MTPTLRDYQGDAKVAIRGQWKIVNSTLAVLATALGKTCLAMSLVKDLLEENSAEGLCQTIVFLTHIREIAFQTQEEAKKFGITANIEMGSEYTVDHSPGLFGKPRLVICMVPTLSAKSGKRLAAYDPMTVTHVIADEAHRSISDSWGRVFNHFQKNPRLKILGLTATPFRHSGEALGTNYESVAFDYGIERGMENGWLVPPDAKITKAHATFDVSKVSTVAGDFNQGELASIMMREREVQAVVKATNELAGGKRAMVFATNVEHAKCLLEVFNRPLPGEPPKRIAELVVAGTDDDDRKEAIRRFGSGETIRLIGVGCFTEGFNCPGAEVGVFARMTKSKGLFIQMLGRLLRPLPGVVDGPTTPEERKAAIAASAKPCAIVLDFSGVTGKHKVVSVMDILGGKYTEPTRERAKKIVAESTTPISVAAALAKAKSDMEAEEVARKRAERQKALQKLEDEHRRKRSGIHADVKYTTKDVNLFSHAGNDTYQNGSKFDGKRDAPWRHEPASEKQKALLRKQRIPFSENITKGEASDKTQALFRKWNSNKPAAKREPVSEPAPAPTPVPMDSLWNDSPPIEQLASQFE